MNGAGIGGAGLDEASVRSALRVGDGLSDGALERALAGLERIVAFAASEQLRLAARLHERAEASDVDQARRNRECSDGTTIPSRPRRVSGLPLVVGAALKASPSTGSRFIHRARRLTTVLPTTLALLTEGVLTAERAFVIVDAADVLDDEGAATLDRRVGAERSALVGMSTPALRERVTAWAAEIDSDAVLARRERAKAARSVSSSALPDGMARVSITAPVEQCAHVIAALRARAAQVIATGDAGSRTRAQVMTDLAVTRLTGQSIAAAVPVTVDLIVSDATLLHGGTEPARLGSGAVVPAPLARQIVHDAARTPTPRTPTARTEHVRTLPSPQPGPVRDGDPPVPVAGDYGAAERYAQLADVIGQGPRTRPSRPAPPPPHLPPAPPQSPTPADADVNGAANADVGELVGDLVGRILDLQDRVRDLTVERDAACAAVATAGSAALRTVYACPDTGALTAMRSRSRTFPTALATMIDIRDGGRCRTPYCGAPIAHHDHIDRHARGGQTSLTNGAGLCARCNLIKDSVTLSSTVVTSDTGRHTYRMVTPGAAYTSTAPPLPTPTRR